MKIQQIMSQDKRDFTAVYKCEHCHATETSSGYDDDNFHQNVIPAMKCKACGKTAPGAYYTMSNKEGHYIWGDGGCRKMPKI